MAAQTSAAGRRARACLAALTLVLALMATLGSVHAQASGEAPADRPGILGSEDVERYRTLFDLQDKGQFARADHLLPELGDRLLVGHVQAQRYLSKTYRARYDELKAWMAKYKDLPVASRVYALAIKRKPRKAAPPERPEARAWRPQLDESEEDLAPRRATTKIKAINTKVRSLVRDERPSQALAYLNDTKVKAQLGRNERDDALQRVAASFYAEGKDGEAYALASEIAARNRAEVPLADWTAGLSAWRSGQPEIAAPHFEALALSKRVNDATVAAGGFWGARAYLASRKPEKVADLLEIAASHPRTFYGVLALRQLGRDLGFDWRLPSLDHATFDRLVSEPAIARAVGLAQVGRKDLAEEELLRAHGGLDPSLDMGLLALAGVYALPSVQLQVAEGLGYDGFDEGRFPIPSYTPKGGFKVDPALIYAFMHKESRFKPKAESHAGARGLMQLMPRTASHVAGDRALQQNKDRLLDPGLNLAIAQEYILDLMNMVEPTGNLFMLAVAYNGGPGNLSRWRRELGMDHDPLLFVESIPAAETRGYIERVLMNYWAYRDRMGRRSATLDAAAAGDWPVYSPAEAKP